MSLKILHTADVHIGKNFGRFSEQENVKKDLVEERYKIIDRLISKANENRCDLFVVAGDLFDNPQFRKTKDVERIRPYLEKFEGKAILILPGNHDYYSKRNEERWGWLEEIDNVLVLKETKPYDISERMEKGKETRIYPGPCDQKISEANQIGWIKNENKDDDLYHIGVAHGHLEGCSYDSEGKYFPMRKDELEDSDLDLWLLGHVHVMLPRDISGTQNYFFPGTPEKEGFKRTADESEKGKAWIIELDDEKRVSAEKIDIGKYDFIYEELTAENLDDIEELKDFIEDEKHENELLRLTIKGKMDKDGIEEAQKYINELREDPKGFKYIEIDDDDFARRIDMALVDDEFSKGSFPHRLLKEMIESDEELSETAAELAFEKIEEVRE